MTTELVQATIDILAWYLAPFAVVVAVSWVVSMFRN